jgi:hypothetical protein
LGRDAPLESLALEVYRSQALTAAQLRRLQGFETRVQVDAFLKEHDVYDFTAADFEQDRIPIGQIDLPLMSGDSSAFTKPSRNCENRFPGISGRPLRGHGDSSPATVIFVSIPTNMAGRGRTERQAA